MPVFIQFLGHYFWLLCMAMSVVNYTICMRRLPLALGASELLARARKYHRASLSIQLALWTLLGAGVLSGRTADVWAYAQPQDGNPYVQAFIAIVNVLALAFAWWVFHGGAKTVVDLRLISGGHIRRENMTKRGVKILAIAWSAAALSFPVRLVLSSELGGTFDRMLKLGGDTTPTVSADGYRVVFDYAIQGAVEIWRFPAFCLIFVGVGIAIVYFRNDLPINGSELVRKVFPVLWLCCSIMLCVGGALDAFVTLHRFRDAIAHGTAKVVAGEVQNFLPMPYGGHAMERFCVQQACFGYSDFFVTGGFNNTASHGGPIRLGLPVRVTYVGRVIVKLEVAAG